MRGSNGSVIKNMTPTLTGRIETRIILGILIALPILTISGMANVFFVMLAIGITLDFCYSALQGKRWDGDWPLIFSLITGIFEGIVLWFIVNLQIPLVLTNFTLVYMAILIITLIAQVILGIFLPYRRFKGGRIL